MTNLKTDDLIEKWSDLRNQKGYMQRINPTHPLNFFVGITEKGFDQLALITISEPSQLRSSKALEVEKNKRKDGKWATQISSIEVKNQEIFARLCIDLVECSSDCKSEQDGISKVTARFLAWQRLFASMHETLPKSVLKGMVGEISYAKYLIEKGKSKDEVINGWVGPNGADRDYVFRDRWFEIKAIATGKNLITISSLNQLETDTRGNLVVYSIDETSKTDPKAISVSGIIADMRSILFDAPEASRLYEEKLISLGYLDKSVYNDIFFAVNTVDYYEVDDTFPKIVTQSVPGQVVGVRYDLSLAGIEAWKVKEADLWN